MIITFRDSYGELEAVGTGTIFAPQRNRSPINETVINGTPAARFIVTIKAKKNTDPNIKNKYTYSYETINCIFYGNFYNSCMYMLLLSARKNERIDFMGRFFENIKTDENGLTVTERLLNIESFTFPSRTAELLCGTKAMSKRQLLNNAQNNVLKSEKETASDDYLF